MFKNVKTKSLALLSVASAVMVAAVPASADIAADIAAAQTAGTTNVGLAITAVVAISALVMGLGLILSLLRR